jgi:membrane-associated phospholipid phosphatase
MNLKMAKYLVRPKAFLQARLSPEGYLGLHLTVGVLIIIAATWIFGHIAEDVVTGDPLTILDAEFSAWLHSHATAKTTAFMFFFTQLGSIIWVLIVSLCLTLFLWRRKQKYAVIAIALTIPGGLVLNALLKLVFQRARPTFDDPLLTLFTYSFPSGHTMSATILYGLLAVFAVAKIKAWSWRILIILLATILISLVGFSRIYLGAHYLSDVLAAIAEGLAWLAVCLTAVDTVRRREIQKLKR